MRLSVIGATLAEFAALEPGEPAVAAVVHAAAVTLAERPRDTAAVTAEGRVHVLGGGRPAQPMVRVCVGRSTFLLSRTDALRVAGRLRLTAHSADCPGGAARIDLLLAAARVHMAADAAFETVALAAGRGRP